MGGRGAPAGDASGEPHGKAKELKGYRQKEQFEQRPWGGGVDCSEAEKPSGRGEGLFGPRLEKRAGVRGYQARRATERVVAFTLGVAVSRKVTQLILCFGCCLDAI